MELIIADRTYAECRTLIQSSIDHSELNEFARERLCQLYECLTTENAQEVYKNVTSLISDGVGLSVDLGNGDDRTNVITACIGLTGVCVIGVGCTQTIIGCIGYDSTRLDADRRTRGVTNILIGLALVTVAAIFDV